MAKGPNKTGSSSKPAAKKPAPKPRKAASPKPSTRPASNPHRPVTAAERGLLAAVDGDGIFDARPLSAAQRVVRSAFLRALLLGRVARKKVPEVGLTAFGLIFKETLDLSYLSRDGECLPPLRLPDARFSGAAVFDHACLAEIDLESAKAEQGVSCVQLTTRSHLWLDRLTCNGDLSLLGAEIGGQISLKGARLKGTIDTNGISGHALSADGAKIKGGVFCNPAGEQRFEADGVLRLVGVEIGGQLNLKGARLKGAADPSGGIVGDALLADGATIKGGVLCDPAGEQRFEADGEVRILGADIGGQLNLRGARLKGAVDANGRIVGDALSADGAAIKDGVFCDPAGEQRFEADGEVRILGADIGGQLNLRGARLKGAVDANGCIVGCALSADRATIKGGVLCDPAGEQRFEVDGMLRLAGAEISGQLSLCGARLKGAVDPNGRVLGDALGAEKVRVSGALFLEEGIDVEGRVNFFGARLNEVAVSGSFKAATADRTALHFGDCEMGRLGLDRGGITGRGQVCLEGARADNIDRIDPALWGTAAGGTDRLELDLDGLTYRRAEFSTTRRTRTRKWARFLSHDPIAENVLDLLDRSFVGDRPKRDHYKPQPFEQAVKALREAGHSRSADEVAVAKREYRRISRADGYLAAFMSGVAQVFFRYGYGPLRASAWTVAFVLLGAWVFSAIDEGGGLVIADPGKDLAAMVDTSLPVGDCSLYPRPDASGCA